MKAWQGTIQRFPYEWQGYAWLGDAYLMKKDYEPAVLNYKKTLELNPNQETYRVLGGTYLAKKDYFQARGNLQKSLELKPDEASTHKKLGELYEETGRFPEAIKAYQRFLQLDPKNPDAAKIRQKIEDLRRR